jgi:hypothetical protein
VVEESFDPDSHALKVYTIAVDVLERDASCYPSIDGCASRQDASATGCTNNAEDGNTIRSFFDVPRMDTARRSRNVRSPRRLRTGEDLLRPSIRRTGSPRPTLISMRTTSNDQIVIG